MDSDGHVVVLLVDDEEDIVETTRDLFEGALRNVRLLTAGGGEEGKRIIDAEHPDIVISDYRMPDINGLELLHHAVDAGAAVTMMITAFPDLEVALKALNSGRVARFFVKPPDPDELLDAVQAAADDIFAGAVREAAFERARAIGLKKAKSK